VKLAILIPAEAVTKNQLTPDGLFLEIEVDNSVLAEGSATPGPSVHNLQGPMRDRINSEAHLNYWLTTRPPSRNWVGVLVPAPDRNGSLAPKPRSKLLYLGAQGGTALVK
jgi:hypothetical protein